MIIKRYLVNNMNEAMTRIRYELGKDAVIISQRKVKKPGFKGFFSKKVIEVTAAIENNKKDIGEETVEDSLKAIRSLMEKEAPESMYREVKAPKKEVFTPPTNKRVYEEANKTSEKNNRYEEDYIINEMKEMKKLIFSIANNNNESITKSKNQSILDHSDVNERVSKKLLAMASTLSEEPDSKENLKTAMENMVATWENKNEGIMILVGPTGVGKTTTIAKLAGRLALIEKKKVGLITVDTYRIGAVEQLRTYAEIMNIPFKVVITTKEMDQALQEMEYCDVVLIDTTGRSSKNIMQISELRAFVEKANTDNIHLVISCTTKNKDIESIVEGYRGLNYNNVIITKLDETSTYGSILNILDSAKKPLSYVTTGQNVPDDIKELTPSHISNLVLGEESIC